MKKLETKKLHYGKYLYKLVLANSLSDIFRTDRQKSNDLAYAREYISNLDSDYAAGLRLEIQRYRSVREISAQEYLDAKDICTFLKNSTDYKVRTSYGYTLTIYSNDLEMLDNIINHMRVSAKEFWKPSSENVNALLNNKNIIIVDKPPSLPIKINFKNGEINKDFGNWIDANLNKCRVGNITLNDIKELGFVANSYMFVRDEKVLNLVVLLVGSSIRSVENLVYKDNLDKYMYGSE